MIASDRTQNIIVGGMIIVALVSSGFLVGNSMYYSGSYALAAGLQVTMNDPVVSNIDVGNESVSPVVSISFQLQARSPFEGDVRITFMGAQVTLNGDLLSYTPFAWVVPFNEQPVDPDYNRTVAFTRNTGDDRPTIIDAYNSGLWNWTVVFRYSFIVFNEPGSISWTYRDFNTTSVVIA
jgi:hypothetical protein